jgi:hypothetical protein
VSKSRRRKVMAANFHGTYNAGTYETESDTEAIELARERYRSSSLGRGLKDVGAFRFWVAEREQA